MRGQDHYSQDNRVCKRLQTETFKGGWRTPGLKSNHCKGKHALLLYLVQSFLCIIITKMYGEKNKSPHFFCATVDPDDLQTLSNAHFVIDRQEQKQVALNHMTLLVLRGSFFWVLVDMVFFTALQLNQKEEKIFR